MPVTRTKAIHSLAINHDDLVLTAFRGQEGLSRLSRFQLDLVSENAGIEPQSLLSRFLSFQVRLPDDNWRTFSGLVSSFERGGPDEDGRWLYFAEVVAWPWLLTRRSTCRVFQEVTVLEIIEQVFNDAGFLPGFYELAHVRAEYRKREYCVQYREADFSFVSRLMEEEGIFYFFRHEEAHPVMVLADQPGAYHDCVPGVLEYPRVLQAARNVGQLTGWQRKHRLGSGVWAQRDYDFKDPTRDLRTSVKTRIIETQSAEMLAHGFYDYPGLYKSTTDGAVLTTIRMEEEEVEHETVRAASHCATLTPGGEFKLGLHRDPEEEGRSYVVTSLEHEASEMSGQETGALDHWGYTNRFTCIPAATVFRPGRRTSKPSIQGLHTAKVMGPEGQEIYTDEYGRVKVQFHWDPLGRDDARGPFKPEATSCWIRVAQAWAGQNWGVHFWPRIGHEVVVAFLEGDPDQPLIIGSVYNGKNMPPYALPERQTQSGIKTRSTPDGGPDKFNEIRFEDKTGEEEIYLHAEKDLVTVVEHDETRSIGNNRFTQIHQDDRLTVEKGDLEVQVLEGDHIVHVKKGNVAHSAPPGTYNISAKEVMLEGSDKITLKVGGSTIVIEPGQIYINSPAIISKAGGPHQIIGNVVSSEADSSNSIKGAMVLINS